MTTGRYQLGDVVGVGSFATVYHADDPLLEDAVVIKMLAENHSLNAEIRERFIAEGRSLRKVASEHVVTVHDIGESARQQPYLVLEYADRGTLADRVKTLRAHGWAPNTDDILSMARPLAQALAAVHSAQLVHRDLSPGNLLLATEPAANEQPHDARLVSPNERLLLADLGMSKDLAMNSGLTVSGGTTGFRPPEQSKPGMVDTRADIWAASALVAWVAEGANLPQEMFRVLQRGMQHNPDDRQQSITSWLSELETALTPPPPPPEPVKLSAANQRSPNRLWLVAVVFAVITGVAGLAIGLLVDDGAPPEAAGEAAIAISGPDEVAVGETATFSADVDGVHSWVWSLPTGSSVVDENETTMTATDPGTTEVILRARSSDGTELETRHQVTVTD